AQQLEQDLQQRREQTDAKWENLEEGWKETSERMVALKIRPRTNHEDGFDDSILGALLEGVWDKERVPRDGDGHIVLDESPACIKHIVHTLLTGRASSVAVGLPERAAHTAVAVDEVPCLMYTAHVMGLPGSVPKHPHYVKLNGGSTILEPFEIAPFGATIREWFRGSTEEMTLLYRATRDGFGSQPFTASCNQHSPTISLIRASSGRGNDDDSVVGGYAVDSWDIAVNSMLFIAPGMSLFMLKDGSASRADLSAPIKWKPHTRNEHMYVHQRDGPCFGDSDLVTIFDKISGICTVQIKQKQFPISSSPPFLALNGKQVVDIEVYHYSTPALPTTTAPCIAPPDGNVLTDTEAHDIRSFGESIASSLMEERVVLDRAVQEMEAAGARVSTAVDALETVYGPSVAAGEQDAVVDLNVRRTRMTTLRSTLQACPQSALATMFDAERWPANEKDMDENGRRLIDCNPTCFAKILDVLRMRKRASWSRGATPEKQEVGREKGDGEERNSVVLRGGVLIKKAEEEVFSEAVNLYFPGCESFIMDLVQLV
ncbi:unnamed protein product, partial [Laminaria digitata]